MGDAIATDIRSSSAGKKLRFARGDALMVDRACYDTISMLGNSVTVVISRSVNPVGEGVGLRRLPAHLG